MYDHRKLGRELGLFGTDPLIGAGLPYWLPDGAIVRHTLEEYVRDLERRHGYQHVYSPPLGKRELYEISGHWGHYRADMFPQMVLGSDELVLRPSLCPHHAVIYRARSHSYRELPLRIAELGGQHRAELSGVLGGLTRVRVMQLNDAHIFCTLDQVAAEAAGALALIREAYQALGIEPLRYRLSLAGPGEQGAGEQGAGQQGAGQQGAGQQGAGGKYVEDPASWQRATAMLREVLDTAGVAYEADPGEAAFYGPKIDVQIAGHAEREATLSTVQLDFYQPSRFDLRYIGADGAKHRPVMVHRSVIGTVERAVAHLIERHGGAFPPWLAPVQLVVAPVSAAERQAGAALAAGAEALGLRVAIAEPDAGTLGARIRASRLVPYLAVVGAKEAADDHVALRLRDGRQVPPLPAAGALARIREVISDRSTVLWA
jgi:threonyl-tRNA synthetase